MGVDPRRLPKRAKPIRGAKEAWWYEEENGISVYAATELGIISVRLPWGAILRAAARSSGREVIVKALKGEEGKCKGK